MRQERGVMLENAPQHDGTVGKALQVLDAVAAEGRPVRFVDLLARSDYPKATLYRLLRTLASQGMLSYDAAQQTYSLGPRLMRLAHAAWHNFSLAPIARPFVQSLANRVRTTVHLAQLDHGQVLYVDKISPADAVTMFSQTGKVGPAYCTGIGKAMLAFLDPAQIEGAVAQQAFHSYTPHTLADPDALRAELAQIRVAGHAFDREEHEANIICAAVPIHRDQSMLGGLSITGSTHKTTLDALSAHLPLLKTTAGEIARAAETWRFPDKVDHIKG